MIYDDTMCFIGPFLYRQSFTQELNEKAGGNLHAWIGSNGVTLAKFLQLLMFLELYLELSYFLCQIITEVTTVTEVTKAPKFLI